jgi:hypothetical protein
MRFPTNQRCARLQSCHVAFIACSVFPDRNIGRVLKQIQNGGAGSHHCYFSWGFQFWRLFRYEFSSYIWARVAHYSCFEQ